MFTIDVSKLRYFDTVAQLASLLMGATVLAGVALYDARVHEILDRIVKTNTITILAACIAGIVVSYSIGLVISFSLFVIEGTASRVARWYVMRRATRQGPFTPNLGSWTQITSAVLKRAGIELPTRLDYGAWSPVLSNYFLRNAFQFNMRMSSIAVGIGAILVWLAGVYRSPQCLDVDFGPHWNRGWLAPCLGALSPVF